MPIYLPELTADPLWFPPLHSTLKNPDGLLAMGGDLSVARLQQAYRSGIFPWFSDGDPLLWWSPDPRAIIDQVKRLTRAGMGPCQGRRCREQVAALRAYVKKNAATSKVVGLMAETTGYGQGGLKDMQEIAEVISRLGRAMTRKANA